MTLLLYWFSQHWLLVANICIGALIVVPLSAPVFMQLGLESLGNFIYRLLRASCHQLPERSFFLFGPQAHYSIADLRQALNGAVPPRYIGNASLGYKVAVCERDTAIYGSMFLTGLLFNTFKGVKPLPIKVFILLILPMVIDGTGQLIGLWTSTWLTRVVTGGIFGTACILLSYPYLQQGMHDIQAEAGILVDELNQ
ncbi:MAG: DUF2085 domain-containing protein [Anaerolineae bacterium]